MTVTSGQSTDRLIYRDGIEPMEQVTVKPDQRDEELDRKIMIHTIHGGDVIPPRFRDALSRHYPDDDVDRRLLKRYDEEKDWGANQLAHQLAEKLGLGGYWRINTARVLLDFGRFPGTTRAKAGHLDRFAINYPFSSALDFAEKKELLEQQYDVISSRYEAANEGKTIKLAVHTYDPYNPSFARGERGTPRPELSLIHRSASYARDMRMPYGIFDPIFPDRLAECTADRKLTARISLHLEKNGLSVSLNHPYYLPDGSLEIRSQVWFFFKYLRRIYEQAHPAAGGNPAHEMVWRMLQDTNLRRSDSESLRSYIHLFRKAPPGDKEALYREARQDYERISDFFDEYREEIIRNFQKSDLHINSLILEVRKDLLWWFRDSEGKQPVYGAEGIRWDNICRIAETIAQAIKIYFRKDLSSQPGWTLGGFS